MFVLHVHKLFVCFNKKVRWSTTLRGPDYALIANVGSSSVRCPSCGHISKTKQDRPIVTMKHCYMKLALLILLPHSDPPQTPSTGKGDRPFSAGCWLIQHGGCCNSQTHAYVAQLAVSRCVVRMTLAVPASSLLKAQLLASFFVEVPIFLFVTF